MQQHMNNRPNRGHHSLSGALKPFRPLCQQHGRPLRLQWLRLNYALRFRIHGDVRFIVRREGRVGWIVATTGGEGLLFRVRLADWIHFFILSGRMGSLWVGHKLLLGQWG